MMPCRLTPYYYDFKLANPAFVGTKAKHLINRVYSGFPSTSAYWVNASYERSVRHGKLGLGGVVMAEEFGAVTSFRAGTLCSHRIAFSENAGFRLGGQVFDQQWAYDYDYYRFIHDGDPIRTEWPK